MVIEERYGITRDKDLTKLESERLWLHRDYEALLEKICEADLLKTALIYGEIGLPTYGKDIDDLSFTYSNQLGLVAN